MDSFQTLSDDELISLWIDHVAIARSIEHIGAYNRHFSKCTTIEAAIVERGAGGPDLFRRLLDHPEPNVRYTAAYRVRKSDPDLFRATMTALSKRDDDLGRDAQFALYNLERLPAEMSMEKTNPPDARSLRTAVEHSPLREFNSSPPPAMTMLDIKQRLRAILPSDSERLLKLAQPAIGLWPQRAPSDLPITASRLGGMPHAPAGFEWPMAANEPMLFLGQINCADLKAFPGGEHFPSHGLLALFGDHDTINGCMFTAMGGAVFYWSDIDALVPAIPPLEPSQVFLLCALAFRPVVDMPHPFSNVIRLVLGEIVPAHPYSKFHDALRKFGHPDPDWSHSFSKLLGWPHFEQGDDLEDMLDDPESSSPFRLLIQIEEYSDGDNCEGYGPGGSLYFMIPEDDFVAGRLEETQLTGQFT